MKNYSSNVIVVFVLISLSIFLGIGTVKAIDTITIGKVKAYNGVNIRITTNKKYAYSVGSPKIGPKKNDKLSLVATYKNGYYLYILNDTKISGSNTDVSRTIKQKAIWKIRGYGIRGSYVNEANKLVNAAKTAGAKYNVNPTIDFVNTPGQLNKRGNYYISDKINVKMNRITGNEYNVAFAKSPAGTEVINKTNNSFQIRVPIKNVHKTTTFNVKVIGAISTYKYVTQYHKDSDTDDVAVLNLSSKVPIKQASVKVVYRTCHREDSTYYGKDGTVVTKEVYNNTCVKTRNTSNKNVTNNSSTNSNTSTNTNSSNETGTTINFNKDNTTNNESDLYKVTLYIVSGKTHNVLEVESGKKLAKPVDPVRKGYKFVGWYTDDTYQIKYDFNTPVTDDLELYARWELKTYKITFDSNGGSEVSSAKVLYNQELQKPTDPTKSGLFFAGWYKDSSFENKFSFLTPISSDMTLYAKWTEKDENLHDVTFVSGFGTDPIIIEVKDGQTVTAPLVTNTESDNLGGWYTDTGKQNMYNFDSPVTEDIVLYAKWLSEEGEEIIETPDTASPAQVLVIAGGILLFVGGAYVFYKQFGFTIKRNN